VEVCLGFDINTLAANENFAAITALFDAFVLAYKPDME
jgi:hypothetical protein